MVLIGLLALVVFGPGKLPGMARDLGRFALKARTSVDELKSELALGENREDYDADPEEYRSSSQLSGPERVPKSVGEGGPRIGEDGDTEGSRESAELKEGDRALEENRKPEGDRPPSGPVAPDRS